MTIHIQKGDESDNIKGKTCLKSNDHTVSTTSSDKVVNDNAKEMSSVNST